MTRLQILLTLCALCIGWVAWDSQYATDEQLEMAVQHNNIEEGLASAQPSYALSILPRQKLAMKADLFDFPVKTSNEKAVRKQKKPTHVKPVEQVVQPLPFTYLGKWQEGTTVTVLIEYQNQVMAIKQGDVLIEQYKVLAIEDLAESIVVTFESIVDKTQQQLKGKG